MKKSLFILASLTLGILTACAPSAQPNADTILKGAGSVVTDNGDNTGTVDVASGTTAIRNTAFTISGANLKLTKAPNNGQCAYINSGTQIYCRIGEMAPLTSAQASFNGKPTAARLAYIDADGKVQAIDATLITKK